MNHLTPGQLREAAGLSEGTLLHWVRDSVLKPDSRFGEGKHRRYPLSEVRLAQMLAEVARYGVPASRLRSLAESLRHALSAGERLGISTLADTRLALQLEDARVAAQNHLHDPDRLREIAKEYSVEIDDLTEPKLSFEDELNLRIWSHIQEAIAGEDKTMHVELKDDDSWSFGLGGVRKIHRNVVQGVAGSWIVLDLRRIFALR